MVSQYTPRLSVAEKEAFLRHVIRVPELFALASNRVKVDHFRDDELHWAVTWQAVLTVASSGSGLLPVDAGLAYAKVCVAVSTLLEQRPELPSHLEEVLLGESGVLSWVYEETASLQTVWGRELLVRFLEEREVNDALVVAARHGHDQRIENLGAFLDNLRTTKSRIDALATSPVRSAAPLNYKPKNVDKDTTGLKFLDDLMNGGDAPGEVYGILGAFGSGKTLLAVQAAYSKSLRYQYLHDVENQPLRHCYIFHYEANFDEVLRRTWSHAARIRADRLENFDESKFSRRGNGDLQDYELELFKSEIKAADGCVDEIDGEFERYQNALAVIGRNLWLCDFGGNTDNPAVGTGYVQEIAATLEQERQAGKTIGSVYIDYAGLACRRHLRVMKRPREDEMRHLVGEFGDYCRRLISQSFGARCYIFHQLSNEANKRSFGSKQHYTDAAEGKNFAENLHFNFELGIKDTEFNCVPFTCTKHRRAPGVLHPHLLYLHGAFGRFDIATDLTINPVIGKPVRCNDVMAVKGGHTPVTNPGELTPSSDDPAMKLFTPTADNAMDFITDDGAE